MHILDRRVKIYNLLSFLYLVAAVAVAVALSIAFIVLESAIDEYDKMCIDVRGRTLSTGNMINYLKTDEKKK